MRRVGFVRKPGSKEANQIAGELAAWLIEQGIEAVYANEDGQAAIEGASLVKESELGDACDLAVVLGGDGTLLRATNIVADQGVPILGVNLGRLGFLTPFDPSDAKSALEQALAGKLPITERMRICVRLFVGKDGSIVEHNALNDALITRSMSRPLDFRATLDGDPIAVYKADGIIVATPTGSTAYNLAAGGPILMPGHEAMAITPVAPHALTHRPIVVGAHGTIEVELLADSLPATLSIDGKTANDMVYGDRVEIVRAKMALKLYESPKSHFEILREKLAWGER